MSHHRMIPYRNLDRDSPILSYRLLEQAIVLRYEGNWDYTYEVGKNGITSTDIAKMSQLATAGRGLSTYINQHPTVKNGYASKVKA